MNLMSQQDKKECKRILLCGIGIVLAIMGASCMGVIASQYNIPHVMTVLIFFLTFIGASFFAVGMFGD